MAIKHSWRIAVAAVGIAILAALATVTAQGGTVTRAGDTGWDGVGPAPAVVTAPPAVV
jgi:hypothetical protein